MIPSKIDTLIDFSGHYASKGEYTLNYFASVDWFLKDLSIKRAYLQLYHNLPVVLIIQ